MTRILLTGIHGQVGWELQRTLQPLGEVVAFDRSQLDLAKPEQIRSVMQSLKPTIIVNPAAYTAVDKAESEPELAQIINGTAPAILAEEAKHLDALLLHYSTDYVFDGEKTTPYVESDATHPIGSYGRTKLAGEEAITATACRHLIFRTCWVYGHRGHNFMRTMLRLAAERDELRVVDDQFGAPTWSRMIAETTALALARHAGQQGIYHLAATGECSWHGFAESIIQQANAFGILTKCPSVHGITSADFPTPTRRPASSRLDCTRLAQDFGLRLPSWQSQLTSCLAEFAPSR